MAVYGGAGPEAEGPKACLFWPTAHQSGLDCPQAFLHLPPSASPDSESAPRTATLCGGGEAWEATLRPKP